MNISKNSLFSLLFILCILPSLNLLGQSKRKKAQFSVTIDPEKIDIVRDSFGVPHIFAKTDAEVAYGLAWATLEDEVEIPKYFLAALKNYLGRKEGVAGAKIDFGVQMMEVRKLVDAEFENVPDDFKKVLEGSAQGFNAYISQHPEEMDMKSLLPITAQDVLVGHVLAGALMCGMDGVLNNIVSGGILNQLPYPRENGVGSNGFAFNAPKTQDGSTFLGINAHQPIEGVLSWYEAHVCSEEGWNIVGANFHGSCTMFQGVNENLGWGHTTGDLDLVDVYDLEMHPKKKRWYKVDGEWLKLETYRAHLKVRLAKKGKKGIVLPVSKKYWKSIYGPTLITPHGTFSVRMPAVMQVKSAEQWWRMNKASNFAEFKQALDVQGIPLMNITYADREGNIFQLANGLVPRRDPAYNWKKVLPGNTRKTLWTEYLPVEELAQFKNPASGYVFNTNNSSYHGSDPGSDLDPKDFDPNIGYRPIKYNNRSLRFDELMEEYSGKISYDDFKAIKFDYTFPDSFMQLRDPDLMLIYEVDPEKYPDIADAIQKVRNWDHSADMEDTDFPVMLFAMYEIHRKARGEKQKLYCENKEECIKFYAECLRIAKAHMLEHFGTLDVPLGQIQILARGDKEVPLTGGPDMLRALYSNPYEGGRLRPWVGDSFVELAIFPKDGGLPIIETVTAYGQSNKPGSPHHTDQMELFSQHKMKRMPLEKEAVYKMAERIYHPK